VRRFGDAEGASISDSARRLVGVDAIHFDVRSFKIVRPGANMKQSGGKL
jgi:hypothetical protein